MAFERVQVRYSVGVLDDVLTSNLLLERSTGAEGCAHDYRYIKVKHLTPVHVKVDD
jgi:hypothetical protein